MGVARHIRQDIAEQPVGDPGRHVLAGLDLGEGDFQFREAVLARLIDARMLAGRADELAAEQERQAGMVVPEPDHRFQQVGSAQERRIHRRGRTHDHVVAAAGADMAAIEVELFCRQPDLPRFLVEFLGQPDLIRPA